MTSVKQRYTVSLGSNVRPKVNMHRILTALLGLSDSLWLSRIVCTEPVGMDSDHYFLNTAVCLDSHFSPVELKNRFNHIETSLGRDRSDPLCKVKDRPADIDIVGVCQPDQALNTAVLPTEPYIRPLVIEIWQAQGAFLQLPTPDLSAGVPLSWCGQTIGHQPMRLTLHTAVFLVPHLALV